VGRRARSDLVAAVRDDLAAARGAARAVLAAAESARAQAHRRHRLVLDAYATCLAQLAGARDAARLDILRRFHHESAALSGSVQSLAATCAAGAAGAAWRSWGPTEPERGHQPGLLRIGMITYQPAAPPGQRAPGPSAALPALVPLLDQAHLQLDGEPGPVDAMVAGLLLRALGSTRPGDIRLSIFDPGHLGRTFAAFAPLARAGLLTGVGPGGLGALLDDLAEHIRRINETVLAGEFGSLTEAAAAAAGRRPEPWRIAVLLVDAATSAALDAGQRAQLDRVARTGVACGVHLVVRGLTLPEHPDVERIAVRGAMATCDTTGELPVRLDAAPPAARVSAFCRDIAQRLAIGPIIPYRRVAFHDEVEP
jgi:hypothetical protein